MADAKLTDLSAFTPVRTDLIYGVDDPGGTPASGKLTIADVLGLTASADISDLQETVEDFVGGMVTGNTETLITVTYEDGDGTLDFVVNNDLSAYSNTSSKFVPSDPTAVTGADQITNMMSLTQAEYDAITPNASTFYVIVG